MNQIRLIYKTGRIQELENTPYAGLRDVMLTVAQEGPDALYEWCMPIDRPPVEDLKIHSNGDITLFLMDLDAKEFDVEKFRQSVA